jgi:tRNA 2-thiouridine synthesizing protein A
LGGQILVDARGHRCPVPTLRLARAFRSAPDGATLRLLADDPLARLDVPHFAAEVGAELLQVEAADGGFVFLLRKPGPEQDAARRGSGAPPGV